jgi:serine acetyltransferase
MRRGAFKHVYSVAELNSVRVGNEVAFERGCKVQKITVGDSAFMEANAVVLNNVPASCSAVGASERDISVPMGI